MFSKNRLAVAGLLLLIALHLTILTVSGSRRYYFPGPANVITTFTGPFQEIVSKAIRFSRDIWYQYFFLVSVGQTNERLEAAMGECVASQNRCVELALSNSRLRSLLNFRQQQPDRLVAAEVIGKDPSAWYKSVVIDKGLSDGVSAGRPVLMAEGVVGMVTQAANHYATVLLVIDQNSAVDALIQSNRARGVVKGLSADTCRLLYVLRKHEVMEGDLVISSGLDGVFPKGLRIGSVMGVEKTNTGVFQAIQLRPFVNFEKLEEVMVLLSADADLDAGR